MNYVADAYVTHDSLDELVTKRGKEGWSIHQILEVKHWDTAAVTVIWEASSASENVIPSSVGGRFPVNVMMATGSVSAARTKSVDVRTVV